MSESVEYTSQTHNCELLNLPQDLLVQLASGIGCSNVDLRGYLDYFKHFSGLQEQATFNIRNIKQKYKGYGKESEAAGSAFYSGMLMTFELVRRTVLQTKLNIPDPPFYSELPIDNDPHYELPDDQWVIDLCDREELLPEQYPNFFEACLVMAGNATEEEPQELRKILYSPGTPSEMTKNPFYLINYLSGAAELLNHLERHAWIEKMRASYTVDELKAIDETVSKASLDQAFPPPYS